VDERLIGYLLPDDVESRNLILELLRGLAEQSANTTPTRATADGTAPAAVVTRNRRDEESLGPFCAGDPDSLRHLFPPEVPEAAVRGVIQKLWDHYERSLWVTGTDRSDEGDEPEAPR
jgi:hypothetical protein